MRGILYTGTLVHDPRCSRRQRIDEADINTPVAVNQRAANCLEEAVRSFITVQNRCRSSRADVTFRRPLPVFRVVRCSSVHCFHCGTVQLLTSSYCAIGKFSFSMADNPPPVQTP
ncbi:uncharacterized protein TNCV_888931 [Trichonephila clavipes]|nr:uncharacterized protein TNCV_888931 [Trichonephila clavipes]